jgi:anti-sigma factor ChrR (cupin superfamily)
VLAAIETPGRYTVWGKEGEWTETGLPGIRSRILAVDKARGLVTMVLQADPGAVYPSHRHSGPEECYVLKGSVVIDGRVLRAGDFHHADENSDHGEIMTSEGAEVLLVGAVDDYMPSA